MENSNSYRAYYIDNHSENIEVFEDNQIGIVKISEYSRNNRLIHKDSIDSNVFLDDHKNSKLVVRQLAIRSHKKCPMNHNGILQERPASYIFNVYPSDSLNHVNNIVHTNRNNIKSSLSFVKQFIIIGN